MKNSYRRARRWIIGLFCHQANVVAGAEVLSERQREILLLMAQGASRKMVAGNLALSTKTVNEHLARAFQKLGVNNLIGAIRTALRRGEFTTAEFINDSSPVTHAAQGEPASGLSRAGVSEGVAPVLCRMKHGPAMPLSIIN